MQDFKPVVGSDNFEIENQQNEYNVCFFFNLANQKS